MVAAQSPLLRLLFALVFAVANVVHLRAIRLDEQSSSASRDSAGGLLMTEATKGQMEPEPYVRSQREQDLGKAAFFVEVVDPTKASSLSEAREILERFDAIRRKVLAFRDPLSRHAVRSILRGIREKSDVLEPLAAQWQALGEEDDGGDELPSQRDTICKKGNDATLSPDFREMLQILCSSLDAVHEQVAAGDDEEAAAFAVAGALCALVMLPEYHVANVGWGIDCVLGEERRWVAKQLARRSAAAGAGKNGGSRGLGRQDMCVACNGWKSGVLAEPVADSTYKPAKALSLSLEAVESAPVESHRNSSLASVHASIQRLDVAKVSLVAHIKGGSPAFRDRVREVLLQIQEKKVMLQAIADMKTAGGEVDHSGEMLPSERDTICKNIYHIGLEPGLFKEAKGACDALDKLHTLAMNGKSKDAAMFEVLGRLAALKRRPGYWESPIAYELDVALSDEWYWLAKLEQ